MNDFILSESQLYQVALLAVTYVAKIENRVIAYFSLANDRVSLGDFESKTEFNRFRKHRFINEKRIKSYPAVKVCRFAVDKCYAGSGIGTILLDFERNNFSPMQPNDNDEHTRLYYFDLNDYKDFLNSNIVL